MAPARALGGLLGPAAFVTAWSVLGARTEGYSPIDEPISRLAAAGASTQLPMTAGFLAFALGVGAYAQELRDRVSPAAGAAALVCAAASIGIAATPLDSAVGGDPHAVAAGLTYASLAAVPLLAAGPVAAGGHRLAALLSRITGVVVAGCLVTSTIDGTRTGLWQRAGLILGDAWIATSAMALSRR